MEVSGFIYHLKHNEKKKNSTKINLLNKSQQNFNKQLYSKYSNYLRKPFDTFGNHQSGINYIFKRFIQPMFLFYIQ